MKNIHPIDYQFVPSEEREIRNGQYAKVFWFTGLSGSGKSTLAIGLERKLFDMGFEVVVLDGDNVRSGLNKNLSFSPEDRKENIRRVAEVAKLFISAGQVCFVTFISPTKELRDLAKEILGAEDFVEVFIDTPIEICEARDVKGLYKKARGGEIDNLTGIGAPYEPPENPDILICTKDKSVEESLDELYNQILKQIKW